MTMLEKILANLTAHSLKGCAEIIGNDSDAQSALARCIRAGWDGLETAIEEEYRAETKGVFMTFFGLEGEWGGEQIATLMRDRCWDSSVWEAKFSEIDSATLQGITFDSAVNSFARAFFQEAKQVSHFQNWFQAEQTQRQVELLEEQSLSAVGDRLLARYRQTLERQVSLLPFDPILHRRNSGGGRRPSVADVYTDLDTQEHRHFDKEHAFREQVESSRDSKVVSALEVLRTRQRLILLGDPGSGKSTFLKFVAHCLCRAELQRGASLKKLKEWEHGPLVPVWVELRYVADCLKRHQGGSGGLRRYLMEEWLADRDLTPCRESLGDRLNDEQQPMLIMFDGLDEASTEGLQEVVHWINEFVATYPQHRYVVTCRPYAYVGKPWILQDFHEATLARFDEAKIQEFVEKWYGRIEHLPAREVTEKKEELLDATRRDDLRGMAERPLLLTVMAQLHASGGRLPEDRTELYQDAVDLLMHRWTEAKKKGQTIIEKLDVPYLKKSELLKGLYQAARRAHAASGHEEAVAEVQDTLLVECLSPYLRNDANKARQFVEYIRAEAGLLIPYGVTTYRFPHRSFQEFLAACSWVAESDFAKKISDAICGDDTALWREVFVLAVGQAARTSSPGMAADAVHRVVQRSQNEGDIIREHELLQIASEALCEIGLNTLGVDDLGKNVLETVRQRLVASLSKAELTGKRRNELAVKLHAVGDPRKELVELDQMAFCHVPPGDVWLNIDSKTPEEGGHLFKDLKHGYWMGKYPVTKAQFKAYLREAEREAEDIDSIKGEPTLPVNWVSWNEIGPFCEWLTARWRDRERLPKDWEVRLPTALEWEKSARGGVEIPREPVTRNIADGLSGENVVELKVNPNPRRVYPWAADNVKVSSLANVSEFGLSEPSALGLFPRGVGPYGCWDQAGNVWEWTMTPYEEDYPPKEHRVLKWEADEFNEGIMLAGGGFYVDESGVGCSARDWLLPDGWHDGLGFRVSLSPVSPL